MTRLHLSNTRRTQLHTGAQSVNMRAAVNPCCFTCMVASCIEGILRTPSCSRCWGDAHARHMTLAARAPLPQLTGRPRRMSGAAAHTRVSCRCLWGRICMRRARCSCRPRAPARQPLELGRVQRSPVLYACGMRGAW